MLVKGLLDMDSSVRCSSIYDYSSSMPNLKAVIVRESKIAIIERAIRIKEDICYAYHPHNANRYTTSRQKIDFEV
tara:strand:- start:373 stop:597 length:225 start_codon:yes stop_codon:yes gene_type:complete